MRRGRSPPPLPGNASPAQPDRKSTRLNSSHLVISYAVFCLKKNTVQAELIEAARMYHLSPWRRFWRLQLSLAFASLVWNMLMSVFFFFNDTATTEIYTLSLHDALPISNRCPQRCNASGSVGRTRKCPARDRKSTRLNSSHLVISYAVFCLKKKKTK